MSDDGKIIEFPKKDVIADASKEANGIQVSPHAMAMLDVALTAEMLNIYAMYNLNNEIPDQMEEARATVKKSLEETKQFDLSTMKYRLFDALQCVMTDIARMFMEAAEKAEDAKDEQPDAPAESEDAAVDSSDDTDTPA